MAEHDENHPDSPRHDGECGKEKYVLMLLMLHGSPYVLFNVLHNAMCCNGQDVKFCNS